MNRDMKIGLVLGLLLLGTVGAVFFRNEPNSKKQTPRLKNPKVLANELEATDGPKPYLQSSTFATEQDQEFVQFDEIETDDEFFSSSESSSDFQKNSSYEELPPTPAKNRSFTQDQSWLNDRNPSPSQRSKRETVGNTLQTAKKSSHQQTWDALSKQAVEKAKPRKSASGSDIRIHRVRSGETLSSLATYYLGSETRYMELYKLNKNVLKNPNRLRVGMKLRIPPAKGSQIRSRGTASNRTVIGTPQLAPPMSSDRPSSRNSQTKRRTTSSQFLPVHRSPLPGQRRRNN